MIPNAKGWQKKSTMTNLKESTNLLSTIKRNNIKNNGDFYCLDCLHSFRTENKLKSHKNVCEIKDFCNIVMLSEDTKIRKLNMPKNL